MRESKFGGLVVILSVIALSMVLVSVVFPWYHTGEPGSSNEIQYYLDSYWSSYNGHAGQYFFDADGIMSFEEFVFFVWTPLTLLFLGAVLLDWHVVSLIWGWALAILGIVSAAYFAIAFPRALQSGSLIGFSVQSNSGSLSMGWFMIASASIIQTIAIGLRTSVVWAAFKAKKALVASI